MSFSTNEPFEVSRQDKLVGLFTVVGIVSLLTWYVSQINVITNERWLNVFTYLSQSYGINKDSSIMIAGVPIGKVNNVSLTNQGKVKLHILLDKEFSQFFKVDSTLIVDSKIGINSVIAGKSLILKVGDKTATLEQGATLLVTEPKSIVDFVKGVDLEEIITKVTLILDNLATTTQAISKSQNALQNTIDNAAKTSEFLAQASQSLPLLVESSNQLVVNLSANINNIQPKISTSLEILNKSLKSSEELMSKIENLTETLTIAAVQTPDTMNAVNATMYEINQLSRTIRHHWLLKKQNMEKPVEQKIQINYPTDWTIYDHLTQKKPDISQSHVNK